MSWEKVESNDGRDELAEKTTDSRVLVTFEQIGRVAVLVLRRPEARNAVNRQLALDFEVALDQLEDCDAYIGVLTHEGPAFSAGADLKEVAAGHGSELETVRGGFGGLVLRERKKPLIAAVEGIAAGGGCEFALACDLVVASRSATFALPEVKRSLLAAAGGLVRLPRRVPPALAMRMALTGEPISAEVALRYGLVTDLVEPGHAVTAAMALAETIARNSPLAVQAARQAIIDGAMMPEAEAWSMVTKMTMKLVKTEDFKEGIEAFVDKREPRWRGR